MSDDRPGLPPSYQQNTCGHGVDRTRARCADCATTKTTTAEETA